jgi:hypothetical protein
MKHVVISNVHIFMTVRVMIHDIEADTHLDAIRKADAAFDNVGHSPSSFRDIEFVEGDTVEYYVHELDENGEIKSGNSKFYRENDEGELEEI